MKKYTSLGELLTDYRSQNNVSQSDFAAKMNVDVRTIIRWESNHSLIKPEKEKELLEESFIPYQVIRNLNTTIAIPTYYDFTLRKYALAERSIKLPSAQWIKEQMDHPSDRIRGIKSKPDIDLIVRYAAVLNYNMGIVSRLTIEEAAKLLPALNLIIFDEAGYYSGHCVILPIKVSTYQKLKDREMDESQITVEDFVNFRNNDNTVFHIYEVTADCNENVFYLLGAIFKFFNENHLKDYTVSSITTRHDSCKLNEQLGLNLVWGNEPEQGNNVDILPSPRFYKGNFDTFLGK